MSAGNDNTIYIKADKSVVSSNKRILIEDIVKLYGTDKKTIKKLNKITAINVDGDKQKRYAVSILKVMELLHRENPSLTLQTLGENEFVVEYQPPGKKKKALEILKLVIVSLVIFFGAAFTIMTFNEDASTADIFELLYGLVGEEESGYKLMEIGYSIGLPLGIVIFYNHFSKVRFGSDPTPLQTQMRIYEEDTDKTIIKVAGREGKMMDAD